MHDGRSRCALGQVANLTHCGRSATRLSCRHRRVGVGECQLVPADDVVDDGLAAGDEPQRPAFGQLAEQRRWSCR